jgi:RNA polymerase sigma-B factor
VNAVVTEGRSLRNVGSSLGVSAMTVQRRVKRGLKQLELKLSDLQPAD